VAASPERANPTDSLGLIGAVVGVLMLPFLAAIWLSRRREIRRLRARMDAGARRQAELAAAIGVTSATPPAALPALAAAPPREH
jgi:hypothetical protein